MATWTGVNFLDALETQLEARANLAGVSVFTAHPGDNHPATEAIVFTHIEGEQSEFSGAEGRLDEYRVHGFVWVRKPGGGDAVWKEARDRAEALLTEVETELRSNKRMNDTVTFVGMANIGLEQGVDPATGDRATMIPLQLRVLAHLT